jgi:hypothetical protein
MLERPETEIHFVLANGMFKIKIDIDRHGPRPMPNNCKNFNPPNFSLPSTFNAEIGFLKFKAKEYPFNCFSKTPAIVYEVATRDESIGTPLVPPLFWLDNIFTIIRMRGKKSTLSTMHDDFKGTIL